MSDIAVYSQRNAQPTSGAGAVAVLIGEEPSIIIHPQRASNFMNALDFYKPHLDNDYPIVDGKSSTDLYIKSLIRCWGRLLKNKEQIPRSLRDFDFFCFHSPFTKQVRKAFLALLFHELKQNRDFSQDFNFSKEQSRQLLEKIAKNKSFYDRETQKTLKAAFKEELDRRLEDSLILPALVGNIYTGSLYLSLISIVYANSNRLDSLRGKRVMLYSYGSGLTSSLLHLQFSPSKSLDSLIDARRINEELKRVNVLPCSTYFEIQKKNRFLHTSKSIGSCIQNADQLSSLPFEVQSQLWPETFYLKSVNANYVREYVYLGRNSRLIQFAQTRTQKLSAMKLSNRKLREMSIDERQSHIAKQFNEYSMVRHLKTGGLTQESADHMTENCIGRIAMPLSVVTGLVLNGKEYTVPMSTEEASVVAAANRSLKTIRSHGGGFWGYNTRNVIRGQIYVIDFQSLELDTFVRKTKIEDFNIDRKFPKKHSTQKILTNEVRNDPRDAKGSLAINSGFETKSIFRPSSNLDELKTAYVNQNLEDPQKLRKIHISVDIPSSIRKILQNKNKIMRLINTQFCPHMFKLGGGAFDIYCKVHDETSFSVSLLLDVVDAMGANTINTALEKMKPIVMSLLVLNQKKEDRSPKINSSPILMSICSNLAPERVTRVGFKVPVSAFDYSESVKGLEVCQRICMAARIAKLDLFRAVTHNKGIMNGVSSVLLALGQDTRAVEAGSHVYSVYRNGQYQSLSDYYLWESKDELFLCGELEMPLSIGTVGGVLRMNPLYQSFLSNMKIKSSKELSQVVACIGLANNLAAIRALVTEGIQKGHMKLHAKNLALYVGVPINMVEKAVEYMERVGKYNMDSAKEFMKVNMLTAQKVINKSVPKL